MNLQSAAIVAAVGLLCAALSFVVASNLRGPAEVAAPAEVVDSDDGCQDALLQARERRAALEQELDMLKGLYDRIVVEGKDPE